MEATGQLRPKIYPLTGRLATFIQTDQASYGDTMFMTPNSYIPRQEASPRPEYESTMLLVVYDSLLDHLLFFGGLYIYLSYSGSLL